VCGWSENGSRPGLTPDLPLPSPLIFHSFWDGPYSHWTLALRPSR
jgi:hypothetical protein